MTHRHALVLIGAAILSSFLDVASARSLEVGTNGRFVQNDDGTPFFYLGDTKAFQTYTPPSRGRGQDWLLIIEDAGMNFPTAGSKPW